MDAIESPIADKRAVLPVASLGDVTAEPTDPSPSLARGELLTDLGDAVIKTLLNVPVAPLVDIQIGHLGGALAEATADRGARGQSSSPTCCPCSASDCRIWRRPSRPGAPRSSTLSAVISGGLGP
ncbi:hypothetical protein [Nocardia sp. NPDC051463]|uniref:hypothetical protein n=1 Tax=Nocardia sp. NPDC051463 TaxID=3154845 RepID=UPI00344CA03C